MVRQMSRPVNTYNFVKEFLLATSKSNRHHLESFPDSVFC